MKTHEWSPNQRSMALGLIKGRRHSLDEITQITNIPNGTLMDIKKRDTVINKPRSGRPKKLSTRTINQIKRHIRRNRSTRRLHLSHLIKIFQLEVCESTLRSALNDIGYYQRVSRRRPFLSKRDRQRRLQFAKEHLH